jgi:hypothetical protein
MLQCSTRRATRRTTSPTTSRTTSSWDDGDDGDDGYVENWRSICPIESRNPLTFVLRLFSCLAVECKQVRFGLFWSPP